MDTLFALPNHHDWADVRFEFPDNSRITQIHVDVDNGVRSISIPLYVLDSNQYDLIGKHAVSIRYCSMHLLNELDKMFHKYPNLSDHIFRIGRLGYKGDPRTEYIIEEVDV